MFTKYFFTSVLFWGCVSSLSAQTEEHVDFQDVANQIDMLYPKKEEPEGENVAFWGMRNCIKVDGNTGAFISNISGVHYEEKSGMTGFGTSIAYEHMSTSFYGFGINGILENGEKGFHTGFFGPSVIAVKPFDHFCLESSVGTGMGAIWYNSYSFGKESNGGFGYFVQVECSYKINKWMSFALGLRFLKIICAKPVWIDNVEYNNYGTSSIRFTVGPRFYF